MSNVLFEATSQENLTPISVVTGVYWNEIDSAEVYEASITLVYKTTRPGVDMAYLSRPKGEVAWLNKSLSETADNFNLFSEIQQHKRSLRFIGNFAHWCCGVITGKQLRPLYVNQENLNLFEHQLHNDLQEAYSEIDNLTFSVSSYSQEVSRTFSQVIDVGVNITKMFERMFRTKVYVADQKNNYKTYSLLQLNALQSVRQLQVLQLVTILEILSQCRERKIPNSIISLSKFKSDLIKLAASVRQDDYELVITPEEVTKYLKLEIADCVISGSTIVVSIKVPIRKLGARWRLFEVISVPFAWKYSTCSIHHEVTYLAADNKRLMAIQGSTTHDCQPYKNALCFIPRYAGDAVSGSLCPRVMFIGATIQELSSVCAFSCVPSTAPILNRVEELVFILTHISGQLELECLHGENQIIDIPENGRPGALQIKVACGCKLLLNNQVIVYENYPCYKRIPVSEIVHIVPALWSKLKTLKVPSRNMYSSSTFTTLDECLDESWPTVVPYWNMTYAVTHRDNRLPLMVVLILVFISCWVLARWCCRWRNKRSTEEVPMAGHRETQDNDGLPRRMPLAEIDGRELRITLEWWEMDKTIDKRELQDRRQSETRGGEKQLIWCGVTGPGIGYPFQRPEVHPQKEKTMTSLVRNEKQPYADDHRADDVFTITFKLFSPSKDSRNSPSKKRWYGVGSRLSGQWTGEQTDRERRRDETEEATTPRRRHGRGGTPTALVSIVMPVSREY
ncbi:hypothetical protein J6590_092324 [Homalodisca vitripennis]|nr:hypothetical protein J6590_092324 [Homalodisca vitripennis]